MKYSLFRRLAALFAILGMALAFAVTTPAAAGAQALNPCLPPTIPPVLIPAPTDEPTATERPIGIPPTAEPTDLPITDVRDFSQRVDDNDDKTSLPTVPPKCDPRETPVPTEESCDPPGPMLTPVSTVTPTSTTEPTVTPSPTVTATATFPIPGFTDDLTLAFAQIDCDDDGDGDGGDDGDDGDDGSDPTPPGYDLPKTGAGDDNGLASTLIIGAMAAATLLFAAGVTSSRKRNQQR
jgi:hypothetical protein